MPTAGVQFCPSCAAVPSLNPQRRIHQSRPLAATVADSDLKPKERLSRCALQREVTAASPRLTPFPPVLARNMKMRIRLCAVILTAVQSTLWGQLPNPTLNQIFPPGAQVGESVTVTVAGRDLDEATRLIFSHPGIYGAARVQPPGEFEKESRTIANQFTIEVPTNVPPGRYDVRVVGRFGASTPRTFYVDTAPHAVGIAGNNTPDKAMDLPLNSILYGRADGNAIDYYTFSASKGQSLVIECLAQRIDSRMQPILFVTDVDGKLLKRSPQSIDPILQFEVPADGKYRLGVHDHVYGGGGDFTYRLRVHSQAYIATVVPSVGQPGSSQVFQLIGLNLKDSKPSSMQFAGVTLQQVSQRIFVPNLGTHDLYGQIAATRTLATASFPYQLRTGTEASNSIRIGLARFPVTVEQGDNDLPSKARKVSVPTEYAGRFYPRRDQDWIQFEAKKGQKFQVSVLSHRLGHHTDPEIFVQKVVTDEKGNQRSSQVSTQDDAKFEQARFRQKLPRALDLTHQDPEINFTADQDAIYRVGLRDLFGGSRDDPRLAYRLLIRESEADFRLLAWSQRQAVDNDNKFEAASPTLRRGGQTTVYVDVIRRGGFNGEVRLKAAGLPAGVTAQRCVVPAGRSEGVLILSATEDAAAWSGVIQVVGEANLGDRSASRVARAATLLADTGDVRNQRPTTRLTNDLVLSVVDADLAPAFVAFGQEQLIESALGAKLEIPVSYLKRTDVKGELNLAVIGVPNQLKPKDLKLAADAAESKIELALNNAKIPAGSHTIFLRGKVKLNYARNPQAIKRAEGARQQFEQVVQQLAEDEQQLARRLETAKQEVAKDSETLRRFSELEQSIQEAIRTATERAAQSTEQLLTLRKTASASDGDAQIAKAVGEAEAATTQAVAQLQAASRALDQASQRLNQVRTHLAATKQEVESVERQRSEIVEKRKRADEFKKTLDKRVEDSKKNFGPKEINTWVDSSPITLHIHKSPISIELPQKDVHVDVDGGVELPVTVQRRFGFADEVQLQLQLPKSVKGVSAETQKLAKDQGEGVLKIVAGKDATKGNHRCTLNSRLKFNGLDIEDEAKFVLRIK